MIVRAFAQLEGIGTRYPDDDAVRTGFEDSPDDEALTIVAQYVETVSCLARRRVRGNAYLFENFEWLATYSVWWKDTPRPRGDRNYDPAQFAGITFKL